MQYIQKTDGNKIQKFQSQIWTFVTNAGNVRIKSSYFHGATVSSGPGPPNYRVFTITLRHITLGRDSSRRVTSPTQKPLPDNT